MEGGFLPNAEETLGFLNSIKRDGIGGVANNPIEWRWIDMLYRHRNDIE